MNVECTKAFRIIHIKFIDKIEPLNFGRKWSTEHIRYMCCLSVYMKTSELNSLLPFPIKYIIKREIQPN